MGSAEKDDFDDEAQMCMIPVVDMSAFLAGRPDPEACGAVATALETCGCLVVRDPRVDAATNENFLTLMERYFAQSDGKTDARPELYYQVGVTPSGVERPRDHGKTLRDGSLSLKDMPKTQ